MDQWGVFGVIAALVTFGVCVGSPLLKLNSNITRLNTVLELFQKQFADEKVGNEKEHLAIWDKVEEHDSLIHEHDTEIKLLKQREK